MQASLTQEDEASRRDVSPRAETQPTGWMERLAVTMQFGQRVCGQVSDRHVTVSAEEKASFALGKVRDPVAVRIVQETHVVTARGSAAHRATAPPRPGPAAPHRTAAQHLQQPELVQRPPCLFGGHRGV